MHLRGISKSRNEPRENEQREIDRVIAIGLCGFCSFSSEKGIGKLDVLGHNWTTLFLGDVIGQGHTSWLKEKGVLRVPKDPESSEDNVPILLTKGDRLDLAKRAKL